MVTRNLLKNSNNNVFALKVEKTTYKGQFLILIKHINPKWNNNMLFRAKITKNKVLPKSFEELAELEYIKITCVPYEERFLPLSGIIQDDILIKKCSKTKFYPDEYNYLYKYIFHIELGKKDNYNNLIYLGNYNLSEPMKEYYPFSNQAIDYILYKDLPESLLKTYDGLNQKKYLLFDAEHCKKVHEHSKILMKTLLNENYAIDKKQIKK